MRKIIALSSDMFDHKIARDAIRNNKGLMKALDSIPQAEMRRCSEKETKA